MESTVHSANREAKCRIHKIFNAIWQPCRSTQSAANRWPNAALRPRSPSRAFLPPRWTGRSNHHGGHYFPAHRRSSYKQTPSGLPPGGDRQHRTNAGAWRRSVAETLGARSQFALLGADEYASARASTPNAHYTSPEVVQAIWQAMERFGLQPGARILEPSMGVGHFFGLMPESLYPATRRTGVELDSVTARIAAKLYPDS